MSLIDQVRKLEPSDIALGLGILLAVIAPGFLTLYLYRPSLVENLDAFKVILFSISLSLPFIVVNFFAHGLLADSNPKEKASSGSILTSAMAGTAFVLYLALLISFLFKFTFRQHLGAIAGLQLLWFFLLWIVRRHERQGKT